MKIFLLQHPVSTTSLSKAANFKSTSAPYLEQLVSLASTTQLIFDFQVTLSSGADQNVSERNRIDPQPIRGRDVVMSYVLSEVRQMHLSYKQKL